MEVDNAIKFETYTCRQLHICQALIFYSRFKEIKMLIWDIRNINTNCPLFNKQTSFDINKMFTYRKTCGWSETSKTDFTNSTRVDWEWKN